MPARSPARDTADRCPGVLTIHDAADGGLVRVRIPGGLISAGQLTTIATAGAELGNGVLELTSRGNVQLRGLRQGAETDLAARLMAVGLLPSVTHERVRNIVASPLSGIDTTIDLGGLVLALDDAWCAQPRLAELPGRFLVAVDDGRMDVAGLDADLTMIVSDQRVTVGGMDVPRSDAVAAAVALALAFLDERQAQQSKAWRVADLTDGPARVGRRARSGLVGLDIRDARPRPMADLRPDSAPRASPEWVEPVGPIAQVDGGTALAVLAPLGRLTPDQADLLAGLAGPRGLRITPWRSVVVPDVAEVDHAAAAAGRAGLGVDRSWPWYRVSACTGRPGCASALADVQVDARTAAAPPADERTAMAWPGLRVHWSGCERRCGRPVGTAVDVVATGAGYRVSHGPDEDVPGA